MTDQSRKSIRDSTESPQDSPVMRKRGSSSDITSQPDSRTSAAISKVSLMISAEDAAERLPIPHTRIDSSAVFFEKYAPGEFLGEGSYGTVTRVEEVETGEEWASKEIVKERANTTALKMLDREIIILKKVFHPHIVALHEVYETPTTTYIVMEICNGGTLQDVALTDGCIPAFQPQEVATVTRRLMRALAYLHDSGIVHRDMKLENVMLKTKGRLDVKICDFGLCAFLSKDQGNMSMVCGTPAYMAPEVLANQGQYSPLCDVWSVGVMLYQLITGVMPFRPRRDGDTVLDVIKEVPIDLSHKSFEDTRLTDVVKAMLRLDPARRLTAKEVLDFGWVSGKGSVRKGSTDAPQHSALLDMMLEFAMEEAEQARAAKKAAEEARLLEAGPAEDDEPLECPVKETATSVDGKRNGKEGIARKSNAPPRHVSKVDITMSSSKQRGRTLERSPNFNKRDTIGSRRPPPSQNGRRPARADSDSPGTSRKPKANVLTVRLPPLHGRASPSTPAKNRNVRRI